MTVPAFDQDSYRFRDNVPNPTGVNAAFDAGDTAVNTNPASLDVGTIYRIRFLVQETAGGMGNNKLLQFEYRHVEGTNVWTSVTGSSSVIQSLNADFTDHATTTQILGSGTYVTGESLGGDDVDGLTSNIDFAGNDEAETEHGFQIIGADVSDADTIDLRVTDSGTAFGSYTNTPQIIVNKPASSGSPLLHYTRMRTR